jgi:hypothetical protein
MPFLKRKLDEEKIYYTNDEGSTPFKIVVNIDSTIIYKEKIILTNNYNLFVQKYEPIEVYIGNSNINILCNEHKYEGNSILLKIKNHKKQNTVSNIHDNDYKYVYIGHNVYEFNIENDDVFEYFYSVVDEDISYPILVGKKNIYFLLDYVYISRKHFPKNVNLEDSYNYYYESGNLGLYDYEMPIRNKKFICHSPYD